MTRLIGEVAGEVIGEVASADLLLTLRSLNVRISAD